MSWSSYLRERTVCGRARSLPRFRRLGLVTIVRSPGRSTSYQPPTAAMRESRALQYARLRGLTRRTSPQRRMSDLRTLRPRPRHILGLIHGVHHPLPRRPHNHIPLMNPVPRRLRLPGRLLLRLIPIPLMNPREPALPPEIRPFHLPNKTRGKPVRRTSLRLHRHTGSILAGRRLIGCRHPNLDPS